MDDSSLVPLLGPLPTFFLFTGYPAVGKSELAKLVSQRFDYTFFSADLVAKELFGDSNPYVLTDGQIAATYADLTQRSHTALAAKRNVVVDAAAYNQDKRRSLLYTPTHAQCYLVWITADEAIVQERLMHRERKDDSTEKWKARVGWEDPAENPYYKLLGPYVNNDRNDLDRIVAVLEGRRE